MVLKEELAEKLAGIDCKETIKDVLDERKDDIKEVPNGKYSGEIPLTENENIFGSKVKSKLNYPFIQSRGFDRNS